MPSIVKDREAEQQILDAVQCLIGCGRDLNKKDEYDGFTALHHACRYDRPDIVQLLLDHGADVNARARGGWTPLHHASWYGNSSVVKLLLDHGADVSARNVYGSTPLHEACDRGHPEVVRLLLEAGADTGVAGKFGRTPLKDAMAHKGPVREPLIDLFREYHPDLVLEAFCTMGDNSK